MNEGKDWLSEVEVVGIILGIFGMVFIVYHFIVKYW